MCICVGAALTSDDGTAVWCNGKNLLLDKRMTVFAAIKIHYDARTSLAPELKYSRLPTREEYAAMHQLYLDKQIGGNGFHECVNFAVGRSDTVQFYLPTTSLPARKYENEEFLIFSFTYKGNADMSARIVGVHAGARLVNRDGRMRGAGYEIEGVEPLFYHAEAPADLVTLITPPLPYDKRDGLFTPVLAQWGFGRRYIGQQHAANIVRAAIAQATAALDGAGIAQQQLLQRQLAVLRRIDARYGLGAEPAGTQLPTGVQQPTGIVGGLPDPDLGYRGERFVYERELAYMAEIGQLPSEVQWTSQLVPTSPFDIRTLRRTPNGVREHFLEVKSSAAADGENVYVSANQLVFFEQHRECATFALVHFNGHNTASMRELTLEQLHGEFELQPIKYKLARRQASNG